MSTTCRFDDPQAALAAGWAIGMWRISHDDIMWRVPEGEQEYGAMFKGVFTTRDVPHECCGWFFVAKPEDVKAHKIGGGA